MPLRSTIPIDARRAGTLAALALALATGTPGPARCARAPDPATVPSLQGAAAIHEIEATRQFAQRGAYTCGACA